MNIEEFLMPVLSRDKIVHFCSTITIVYIEILENDFNRLLKHQNVCQQRSRILDDNVLAQYLMSAEHGARRLMIIGDQ